MSVRSITVYFLRLDAKNIDELYNKTKEDLNNTLLIYNSLYDLGIIKVDISGTPNSNYIIHKDNIINVYGCIKKYNPKIQIQSVIDLFRDMFTEYHVISNEKISRMIWDECFNIAYKKNFASLEILRDNVIEKLDEQQNMIQEEVD